ncbi:hypothetical protein [Pedobacter deserti]|uniref:hypothetical protein n=1 Tax=Pedobacter deserti TaxID=2817382 RepID=UPI00210E1291|nr:hypothetical protein [Pedobacter sp. SYSU D00382]
MVFIIIIVAAFLLQLVLPWWVVIVISFAVCGLLGKTGRISFWSPFFAVLLLWTGMALFKSLPNHHVLASRIAVMLGLKLWWLVLLVTAVLGGLVAAVSGFCGYSFRKAILANKHSQ